MKAGLIFWLLMAIAIMPSRCGADDSLVVVATRYLQAEGASHAHLYLYKGDGTFLRQLTKFEKGQDQDPLFSPEGKEIVFVRTSGSGPVNKVTEVSSGKSSSSEYWRVSTTGKGLRKLDQVPGWYRAATNAEYFTPWFPENRPPNVSPSGHPDKGWERKFSCPPTRAEIDSLPVMRVTSPDGEYELILKLGPEDLGFNGPGNGKLYELKNLKTGKSWSLGELPGFLGLTDLLHESSQPQTFFLRYGALNVVFFNIHMGSTDGDWCIALDLSRPSLHFLPGDGVALRPQGSDGETGGNATPIPLPGEACFLALGEKRYRSVPGSAMTANISYLSRFDASLKGTSYAAPGTAPQFYGASLYRPGKKPEVMKIGRSMGRN
jgi:hypothetical protein